MELLHLLRWYKQYGGRRFSVLFGRGGELRSHFESLSETWSVDSSRWGPESLRTNLLIFAKLARLAHWAEAVGSRRFAGRVSPGVIYANSIGSAETVRLLAPNIPVVTHIHELDFMIRAFWGPSLEYLFQRTTQFIACSHAVATNLSVNFGVDEARIDTVHEAIPVAEVRAGRSRDAVLRELDIPQHALIVAGSGNLSWIKGHDIFVRLAHIMSRRCRGIYFVWVGGGSAWDRAQFEHDIRLANLTGLVRVTGTVRNPADYLAAADVFVLTSRQDSFPLVALEAAAVGKPIVCFAGAGGLPEFVEDDCGCLAPYLDAEAMANRLTFLLASPDCRNRMGGAARRKVGERHDINIAAPKIARVIERTLEGT